MKIRCNFKKGLNPLQNAIFPMECNEQSTNMYVTYNCSLNWLVFYINQCRMWNIIDISMYIPGSLQKSSWAQTGVKVQVCNVAHVMFYRKNLGRSRSDQLIPHYFLKSNFLVLKWHLFFLFSTFASCETCHFLNKSKTKIW